MYRRSYSSGPEKRLGHERHLRHQKSDSGPPPFTRHVVTAFHVYRRCFVLPKRNGRRTRATLRSHRSFGTTLRSPSLPFPAADRDSFFPSTANVAHRCRRRRVDCRCVEDAKNPRRSGHLNGLVDTDGANAPVGARRAHANREKENEENGRKKKKTPIKKSPPYATVRYGCAGVSAVRTL